MGNAAGGLEQVDGPEAKGSTGGSNAAPSTPKKKCAPAKLPMPPEEELEERFSVVLVSSLYTDMLTLYINTAKVANLDTSCSDKTNSHVWNYNSIRFSVFAFCKYKY